MKTNQLLLGGGVVALIYILYKRKNGQSVEEQFTDNLPPAPEKGKPIEVITDPVISIPTGETKYKPCRVVLAEFEKIRRTSRMTERQLSALRDDMLKGCTGAMPMPTKPFPTTKPLPTTKPPTKPTTKPYYPNGKPSGKPQKPWTPPVGQPVLGFKGFSQNNNINSQLGI